MEPALIGFGAELIFAALTERGSVLADPALNENADPDAFSALMLDQTIQATDVPVEPAKVSLSFEELGEQGTLQQDSPAPSSPASSLTAAPATMEALSIGESHETDPGRATTAEHAPINDDESVAAEGRWSAQPQHTPADAVQMSADRAIAAHGGVLLQNGPRHATANASSVSQPAYALPRALSEGQSDTGQLLPSCQTELKGATPLEPSHAAMRHLPDGAAAPPRVMRADQLGKANIANASLPFKRIDIPLDQPSDLPTENVDFLVPSDIQTMQLSPSPVDNRVQSAKDMPFSLNLPSDAVRDQSINLWINPHGPSVPELPTLVTMPPANVAQPAIAQGPIVHSLHHTNPQILVAKLADLVIHRQSDRIEVILSPEELGNVRIVVSGRDHGQHLAFWVDRPEVLEQLRRNSDLLTRQFQDAGADGSTLEFHQGTGEQHGHHARNNPERHHLALLNADALPVLENTHLTGPRFAGPNRLDVRI